MKFIALSALVLVEILSFVCLLLSRNQGHTIYPFLTDPDMSAWRNVINPGILSLAIIITALGILFSSSLVLVYFSKLRLSKRHSAKSSLILRTLFILSVVKIMFLSHSLYGFLQISSSLKACDDGAPHIKCSIMK
jgi:hypothetical protein